jgi:hypothetical protein
MYQGLLDSDGTIYIQTGSIDVLRKLSQYIFFDRPELFWCTGEMQVITYENYSEAQPVYIHNKEEKMQMQVEINRALKTCLDGITCQMSEYDKIKYVYEYIVLNVEYVLDSPDNQNIYSSMVRGQSVCAGYARMMQLLLQELDIECIYVTGTIPSQGAHAWNIVKCDGKYYHVDPTFGDPVFVGVNAGASVPSGTVNYDYLCITDTEILGNHTMDTLVTFPACTSTDLNYYALNGQYYQSVQADVLLAEMNRTIYAKEAFFTCKFANNELYQQAYSVVLSQLAPQAVQNLLNYYGLERVQYTYVEDPVMNRITIYWQYS